MEKAYYEDIKLHEEYRSQGYLLTEKEIIQFSRKWDPGPFHTDPEFARTARFGGVIASAILLMAIWARLMRKQQPTRAYIAGLGWEKVRFLLPARAGDHLVWEEELLSKRESKSDHTAGILRCSNTLLNHRGEPILTFTRSVLIEKRPHG